MPITTKNDDILISFSYEYPMDDKNLILDFSLFYKDDNLVLKIKNGNRSMGVFPVAMFQEIVDFLSSKGYIGGQDIPFETNRASSYVPVSATDDVLKEMSSDLEPNQSPVEVNDGSNEEFSGDPVQSFTVNYKSSDGQNLKPGKVAERQDLDDSMSVGRFRDDINYVDPGNVPESGSNKTSPDSTIKRS